MVVDVTLFRGPAVLLLTRDERLDAAAEFWRRAADAVSWRDIRDAFGLNDDDRLAVVDLMFEKGGWFFGGRFAAALLP